MSGLSLEEGWLIRCFDGTSRIELAADMEKEIPYLEPEMRRMADQTLRRIQAMTDEEFDAALRETEKYE